jgi:hypothetical protein
VKKRCVIMVLFAFWLAFGPSVSAWAASVDEPCESMGMSAPANDGCCNDAMDQAACLSACLAASPAMAAPGLPTSEFAPADSVVVPPFFRHASVLAPPDIAPPKSSVS